MFLLESWTSVYSGKLEAGQIAGVIKKVKAKAQDSYTQVPGESNFI